MKIVDSPVPQPGDRVQMRKAHPCGSSEWVVFRVGADIGLRCIGCGRRVLMPRREFSRNLKALLQRRSEEGAAQ